VQLWDEDREEGGIKKSGGKTWKQRKRWVNRKPTGEFAEVFLEQLMSWLFWKAAFKEVRNCRLAGGNCFKL